MPARGRLENDPTATAWQGRIKVLWAGCTAHAVQDGLSAAIYVLLPILAQTFGLNYATVGLFKGLKSLVQGIFEITSGLAAEVFSASRLLVFGLALAGAGYLALAFADRPNAILLCFLVVGAGGAFQHALSSALVSQAYAGGRRRGALGLYNSSGDVGKLVFTACFSLAIGAGIAWRPVVFGCGLVAIASAVVVKLALRSPGPSGRAGRSSRTKPEATAKIGWGILDKRGFGALLAVVFLDSLVQAGVLTFVAFVMLAKGVSLYFAGFAAVCILFGGMFGKAFCGFVAERMGVIPTFALAQILTAIGIVIVVVLPGSTAFLLLPALGTVLQGSTSITYGTVDDFVHAERTPRGYALVYASSSFASVLGPVGAGMTGDTYGIAAAMLAMAGISLIAILPAGLLRTPGAT